MTLALARNDSPRQKDHSQKEAKSRVKAPTAAQCSGASLDYHERKTPQNKEFRGIFHKVMNNLRNLRLEAVFNLIN
jgi:hypothetical protein